MADQASTLRRDAPPRHGASHPSGDEPAAGSGSQSRHRAQRSVPDRTGLPARLLEHLEGSDLVEPGQTVVVGVSGGLDSVVLLHALRFPLASRWDLTLIAAHFDHGMRPESAADAAWVAGLCRAWSVPVERTRAEEAPDSEADARDARYRFLDRIADRRGADRIATGHHADDQAETVLFRAIRGTGLRGLAGIPARRGRIVRPLLPFRREALEAYAAAAGLAWREDPSNRSPRYARNRLRHEIVPRLEAISPGAVDALVRLAGRAGAADAAWESAIDAVAADVILAEDEAGVVLARPRLLAYHSHVQARLFRRIARRYRSRPDYAGTQAVLAFIKSGASGSRFDVRGGLVVEREFDRIRVRAPGAARAMDRPDRSLLISTPSAGSDVVVVGGRTFRAHWAERAERTDGENATFDRETLRFPLELRAWRPGDRLRLSYGTKKLKKLFTERRVGRSERACIPVLADADGQVLWVVGVARAHVAAPEPGRSVFRICVSDGRDD